MLHQLGTLAVRTFKAVVAMTPWLLSMYGFYWLDSSGTWTADTPHRGKLSVVILATGMGLSFLIWSAFSDSKKK